MSDATTTTTTSDATLKILNVSPGTPTPGLWGTRTSFAVVLPHREASIRVIAEANDPSAVVRIGEMVIKPSVPSEPIPLQVGRTALVLVVTAADGTTRKEYTVKVTRGVETPTWKCLAETAPFAPRDSAGQIVFNNRMWIIGGYLPHLVSDVWASDDGTKWSHVGDVPDEAGVNIPVTFNYAGRMWTSTQSGKLFASKDGVAWEMVSDSSPCSNRYAAGAAVFKGRMWIMGGMKSGTLFNDIWSSTDGRQWTLEAEHAPWSPRQLFGNVVVHNDKLWVIGGGISNYQPFRAYRDVWCSDDGRNWTCVTDEAPWLARIWSDCMVYRNRIWLFGGYRCQPVSENFRDTWYTADGRNWTRFESDEMWSARHEVSPYVFKDALWLVAGNAWPLVNDVWRLSIEGLTFTSQPVVEEYVNAMYRYRAVADFHSDAGPLKYRLVESPPWLTIAPETGVITGRPPQTGAYNVAVEARSPTGETARQAFTLHVITI